MKKFKVILLTILLLVPSIVFQVEDTSAKTIRELKEQLEKLENEQAENNNNIARTEEELQNTRNQIQQNYAAIEQINLDIQKLDEEIEELNKEIKEKDNTTKNLMYSLQTTNGNSFYLEYLFGADSITDFIYRYSITEQITGYNEKLIEEMNKMIEENEQKEIELGEKQENLKNAQVALESQINVLLRANEQYGEIGSDIEEEIKATKQVIQMYKDAGCGEDDDISNCANQLLPADTKFWRPFSPGYVTSEYGWRYAIYSGGAQITSSGIHEGIDISNGYGSSNPIYSIANGKVVRVWYDQWGGNQLSIHHNINGKSYTSSYAHMSRIIVKKGDVVTKDTILGYMGSTGNVTGPHLHLAISTGLRYTEYTGYSAYVARTVNPRTLINFPSSGGWSDRITYYR